MSYSTQTRSTSFIMSDDRAKKLLEEMQEKMQKMEDDRDSPESYAYKDARKIENVLFLDQHDDLGSGVLKDEVGLVNIAKSSPMISAAMAFEDNSKSYKRPNPTSASKEDLPKEGTSAVDVGGGEVAVKKVDHMLQAEEDRKRYSAFVEEDYSMSGEILTCRICEKNVYSINSDHVKSAEHFQKLRTALNSPTRQQEVRLTKGWQITPNGFFRCYLCQKECDIREHCSSDAHVLSKEYKTCPRIQALKLRADELWKKLPTTIFDELLTLSLDKQRGYSEESSFCVGCDERFDKHIDRKSHELVSAEHRGWVKRLSQSDPFSYSFGILSKTRGKRDYQLRYCMLCKTGMTNAVEQDNHVHGANSEHSKRVRLFWTKVIPGLLQSGLANAFPNLVKDTANYSLNLLQHRRLYYFENLLHVIVISADNFSWCSLCDHFVCDRSIKKHCDSVKHAAMHKCFYRTLRTPNKRAWGLIRKENVHYCVLCHVAFSNELEISVHSNSLKPHLERAQLFNKLFERFITAVLRSLTCT